MTAESATASVPPLQFARTSPYTPPAEHLRLREQAPVSRVALPSGAVVWALTRYEDIRTMLTDPRFSSDRRNPHWPRMSAGQPPKFQGAPSMVTMDPPEHGAARRAIVGEFTVKRLNALRPRVQEIVDEYLDAMLDGPRPVDLVQALSLPVPSLVICELLGVPYEDHDFFQSRSAELVRHTGSQQDRDTAAGELWSYLDELIRAKERHPADDLLGRQIRKQQEAGEVDHGALVSTALLLLLAGHETTANMISLSTMALLERPGIIAAIRQDAGKTPALVEELLRFFTIGELVGIRVATEDVWLGGVLIRANEGVLALSNTANHDPERFPNPDELDIERGGRNHLSFGFGVHQCLGQHLARIELRVVLDTLFRRIPGLRALTPTTELSFKHESVVFGLREFPVTW